MFRILLFLLGSMIITGSIACAPAEEPLSDDPVERARALHKLVPLTDGHNDLPWQYRNDADRDVWARDISQSQPEWHTDIPRLREGQLGAQFWSVYVPASMQGKGAVRATMEEIDIVYQLLQQRQIQEN